jgi:hypothetical protein
MALRPGTLLLMAIFSFGYPPQVHADVAPLGSVYPRFRFSNLSNYPDYDFYLMYGHGSGNPFAKVFVTPVADQAIVLLEGDGPRVTGIYLVAVPHGDPAPWPSTGNGEWGAKSRSVMLKSDALEWSNGSVACYSVEVNGDRVQVTTRGSEFHPLLWVASNGCVALFLGLVVTFILAGWWITARWRGRRGRS